MKVALASTAGLALLLSLAPVAEASEVRPEHRKLSLEESLRIAFANTTVVLKARNAATYSGEQVLQSYAQFLPTFGVSSDFSYRTGKTLLGVTGATPVDQRSRGIDYSITSQLNLFNGLADLEAFKSAAERRRASEKSLEWARSQVVLDVTQAYLQVTLDHELVEIARRNLETSVARLKLLTGQTQVGAATLADLYRQQAETSAEEFSLIDAENRLRVDSLALVRRLRIDETLEYDFEMPDLKPRPREPGFGEDETVLVRQAWERRSDLRAAEAKVSADSHDVGVARADYWPKLNFSMDRTAGAIYFTILDVSGVPALPPAQSPLGPQLGNQVLWTAALTLRWNLFDRGITRLAVERAKVVEDNDRIDLEDLRLLAANEVRQGLGDLRAAVRQVETSKVGLAAASKAFATIQGRYEVGASTFIDLIAAQSALVQAQASEAQALVTLKLRERALDYAMGVLSP